MMHAKVSSFSDAVGHERESTRPIRALHRGLDVLPELNRLERAAINTLAAAVRLPRTTTYRILETLRLAGYVARDAHDDCYRPTIMVRALSDGFDDDALVCHRAKPRLATLGTHIILRRAVETSLAIPVRAKNRILATVTVRYAAAAVPLRTAVKQFLPKMREVAQKIETQIA